MTIAVHVPNKYLSEAVQKNEIEVRGKAWRREGKIISSKPTDDYGEDACINISNASYLDFEEQKYYGDYHKVITVDEYFGRYSKKEIKEIKVLIGGIEYKVNNISKGGFSVGCQFVSWETYDEIGKLRPKEDL